ncbi:MAG: TerC/Alx family metal homeostasis membrane protein [Bacteroidales bacterium]|nr:TerC/Alx family metal homeostasis membrane protein [Bacteroidales bacterium]
MSELLFLTCFIFFVAFLLFLDLGVFHKKDHIITFKEAAIWTCVWIGFGLLFWGFLYFKADLIHGPETMEDLVELNVRHGHDLNLDGVDFERGIRMYKNAMAMEYITGYLIEKTLSIDNIFVMIMIFMAFSVDKIYYHRVLFYGILGAIVMRFIFIFAASALIQKFSWILLIFGFVLLYSAAKMFIDRNKKSTIDVEQHPLVKFMAKRKLSSSHFHGHDFLVKEDGRWLLTPLFLVLLVIEFSDIVFAFDSIPAIFSVTQDPYVVFFSNIFAILGLRSLFFMLESVMDKFYYLKLGLSILLAFIGVKMILPYVCDVHIGTGVSLIVILSILGLSIIASILFPKKQTKKVENE